MSKYIKVNDNIWFLLGKYKRNIVLVGKTFLDFGTFIAIDKNAKFADSIEELCDEFVFINKIGEFNKSHVIYYDMPNRKFTEPTTKEKIEYIKKYYYGKLNQIKGAIYTDKGLIYVAKMNDKGELELL